MPNNQEILPLRPKFLQIGGEKNKKIAFKSFNKKIQIRRQSGKAFRFPKIRSSKANVGDESSKSKKEDKKED